MPIHILPPEVASQIAAGEVIERPASVVKELVENALDAGARTITITTAQAGRRLIEVADDGCGISAGELALAVSRHATSKLSGAEDLFRIATLGFRGEALAAIASVARMTIVSRTAESASGAKLSVEGSAIGRVEAVGAPVGTIVQVENLFFNVPARLKFMKTEVTERRAIDALVTRYALAYPGVRFKMAEGRSVTLQTAGDGDRRAILVALYGVDVARGMLDVLAEEEGLKLGGFISPTSVTRSNRREITFFVNGRWVQDTPLVSALLQAYHTMLMVGRYPLAALFLEVAPQAVDVNVHPAKAEVRFRDHDRVFGFVQRAVRRALLAYAPLPHIPQGLWGTQGRQASTGFRQGLDEVSMNSTRRLDPAAQPAVSARQVDAAWGLAHSDEQLSALGAPPQAGSETTMLTGEQPVMTRIPLLRLIGQVGATYLVAEGPDGVYLIDQHAAHERILFEKLMAQHELKQIASQVLLTPAVVTLPPQSASLLAAQLPVLEGFGFQAEPFGPNTFQVRAVPSLFAGGDPSAALRAVVEDFEEDETPFQNEIEARLAARVCKRLAVKAGQTLSPEEQRALLTDLENCVSPRTCPHGRPTMIHLSVELLERQFGRRGAR